MALSLVDCVLFYLRFKERVQAITALRKNMTRFSGSDQANVKDLAEQRGHLLRDLTDKWAEARVRFVNDSGVSRRRSRSCRLANAP